MDHIDRVRELLSDLVERVEPCGYCEGTGLESIKSACGCCGGTGKRLDATALVQEIEEVKELLK